MTTVLCLAHTHKGTPLLSEAKQRGCRTILITRERFRGADWPWADIDEFYTLETLDEALPLVCEIACRESIDLIFGLHERDVERAASLREFLCLPGMGPEVANRFRDKLCMRELTSRAGVQNPPFVPIFHHPTIHRYSLKYSPPWMLKPRSEAGALGISRIENQAQLWSSIARLGREAPNYLLEQRVGGRVYHLDSLVHQGRVCFSQAHRYATPPFEVWNHGGIFRTASLAHDDPALEELCAMNERVLDSLGLLNGVAHVEFIEHSSGAFFFLEAAARVGGANIDILVEQASGVNLWREWLKIELLGDQYQPPIRRHDRAVLMQCLARDEHPDLSALQAPEIVWRLDMPRHAGLIVVSSEKDAVEGVADLCQRELEAEHLAVVPPLSKAP